ncbi:MAG: class I SAM-dependent methyltransferase [bacterium]|nr:class I SAM-dependent methyltransferase [bacterium]
MDLEGYKNSYDFICSSLNKSKSKVLEISCGLGNVTKYLLSKRPDLHVLGTDIAPNMIELANANKHLSINNFYAFHYKYKYYYMN